MSVFVLATILALSSTAQVPKVEGDPALIELLRDAQATNSARVHSGRMTATLTIRYGSSPAKIVEEIEWSGGDSRISYQIHDPGGFVEGSAQREEDFSKIPKQRLLVAKNKVYGYSSHANAIYVNDARTVSIPYFELTPVDSWFRCCPPQGRTGRPWVEMIGPHPAFPTKNVESYSVSREGGDLIRLIRRDKGRSPVEFVFSANSCMNLVSLTGSLSREKGTFRWVDYRWRHDQAGECLLDEIECKQGTSKDPGGVEFHYLLHVDSIDVIGRIDPSRFTLESFVSDLRNVKVVDRITNRTTFLNVDSKRTAKDFSDQADKVRSRGFAKP